MLHKPDFRGAGLKRGRATKHVEVLEASIDEFMKSKRDSVTEQLDLETRQPSYERITQNPDDDWGLMIGDAAHNFRSCLDHIAWQLARITVDRPDKRLEFPIFKDRGAYFKTAKGGGLYKINELLPKDQGIITDFQPHKRTQGPEQDPLWILYELRNIDTHRKLHTTVVSVPPPKDTFAVIRDVSKGTVQIGIRNGTDEPKWLDRPIDLDRINWRTGTRITFQTKREGNFPGFVAINEIDSPPIHGQDVLALLWLVETRVSEVLRRFEAEYP